MNQVVHHDENAANQKSRKESLITILQSLQLPTSTATARTPPTPAAEEEEEQNGNNNNMKKMKNDTMSSPLMNMTIDPNMMDAIYTITEAVTQISIHLMNYVEHSYVGSQNKSGDDQLHLDVLCDQTIFDSVRNLSTVFSTIATEETSVETTIHPTNPSTHTGLYALSCDPLDGSSIIDANFSVGSIFGIWPGTHLLHRTGKEQIASAMAIYGPRTVLCIALASEHGTSNTTPTTGTCDDETTTNQKEEETNNNINNKKKKVGIVFEITLVQNRTQWELSKSNIQIQPSGKIFAPGNLRACNDHSLYAQLVNYWIQEKYTLRYTGGMVPDVYHILVKSQGIFSNVSSPTAKAKLRLLYEVAPIGFIIEMAGGTCIHESTNENVLDIIIEDTDQRLGVCMGSTEEVNLYRQFMMD